MVLGGIVTRAVRGALVDILEDTVEVSFGLLSVHLNNVILKPKYLNDMKLGFNTRGLSIATLTVQVSPASLRVEVIADSVSPRHPGNPFSLH